MRTSGMFRYLLLRVIILTILTSVPLVEAGESFLDSLEQEMTKLVQRVRPSVVSVVAYCRTPQCQSTRMTGTSENTIPPPSNASLWQTNIGSGCIIDPEGYIVTTENVIHDAHEFEVTFSTGKRRAAHVVGSDPESNIAVLKVEGTGYVPARVGNSDQLKVGSIVTIVGNSFGLPSAVSFGLVNGLREEDDLVQMSAPVSPGNSGAVALNTKGEVIGLVVAVVSEPVTLTIGAQGDQQQHTQQFDVRSQGASLAIPMNKAKDIAAELIEHGVYERGWLGVTIQDLSSEQAKRLNVTSGVLVIDVLDPSPALKADIQKGDVIVQYDGKKVTRGKELFERVQSSQVGHTVQVTVSRVGHEHILLAEIIQRPTDLRDRIARGTPPQDNSNFPPGTASQYNLSNGSIEKRIELIEEEIRQLRKLIRKEQ